VYHVITVSNAIVCQLCTVEGYAPFNSLASRELNKDNSATPGPGQYCPQVPEDYVKVVFSFKKISTR